MDFLFHNLSEKDKEEIKKQVDSILNSFSKKLSTLKEKPEEQIIERQECMREENDSKKPADFSRKIMFDNAPETKGDFIVGERKKW